MTTQQVHPHFDREERTDPITGNTILDTEGHPWVQEGHPDDGLTVYFESEDSMRRYAAIQTERPEQRLRRTLSNDTEEGFDEGQPPGFRAGQGSCRRRGILGRGSGIADARTLTRRWI